MRTKLPQIFAESDVYGDGTDWNREELSILGDINVAAIGCNLVEMPRHADRAYCRSAGGGRIWMEEGQVSERPSESRIQEAVALNGVETLVAACPKDVTIFL